jgi:hypothetical protein
MMMVIATLTLWLLVSFAGSWTVGTFVHGVQDNLEKTSAELSAAQRLRH